MIYCWFLFTMEKKWREKIPEFWIEKKNKTHKVRRKWEPNIFKVTKMFLTIEFFQIVLASSFSLLSNWLNEKRENFSRDLNFRMIDSSQFKQDNYHEIKFNKNQNRMYFNILWSLNEILQLRWNEKPSDTMHFMHQSNEIWLKDMYMAGNKIT